MFTNFIFLYKKQDTLRFGFILKNQDTLHYVHRNFVSINQKRDTFHNFLLQKNQYNYNKEEPLCYGLNEYDSNHKDDGRTNEKKEQRYVRGRYKHLYDQMS